MTLQRNRIRYLRASDPIPEGAPRRYISGEGYVRLRWPDGNGGYLETYERDATGRLVRTRPSIARRLDVAEVIRRYQAGQTLPEIGRALDCDTGALSRLLRRHGVAARQFVNPERDPLTVAALYEAGRSMAAIGRLVNHDRGWVQRVLVSQGVTIRTTKTRVQKGDPRADTWTTGFNKMRPIVAERSEGICEARVAAVCQGRAIHVHHRKLRGQGGDNSLANLLHCCARCHLWAHAHPAQAYRAGLLVRSTDDPSLITVQLGASVAA